MLLKGHPALCCVLSCDENCTHSLSLAVFLIAGMNASWQRDFRVVHVGGNAGFSEAVRF